MVTILYRSNLCFIPVVIETLEKAKKTLCFCVLIFSINFSMKFTYFRNDSNETSVIDPYASDMHFVAVNQRAKRGFFDGLHFRLQAPGVDWRKLLGSEDVGASFGIIIENYLDLKIG